MTRPALIVDTETTSLLPDYEGGTGTIWELAAIEWNGAPGREYLWRMPADTEVADPQALAIGGYYEHTAGTQHHPGMFAESDLSGAWWSEPALLAPIVAALLKDVTIIGAVPSFDERFMTAYLHAYGEVPSWHHRIRDIGSMAWAYLHALARPSIPDRDSGTDKFAIALGVDPGKFKRHSALGDCHLVAAMLAVIEGGPSL